MEDSPPNIVVLGGGTGSFMLLQGIKKLTPHVTAIVNMSDDGGSTGTLRDELGVLPPGDIRQCLVALSDTPVVRNLFDYRFSEGSFAGQSLGNIILSGLELQYNSFQEAVRVAGEILHVQGAVVPVTLEKHQLVVTDGEHVHRGQHFIDGDLHLSKQSRVTMEPLARLNPEASHAISTAELVIIAPGSLYTSLLPVLAIDGMATALNDSAAKLLCIANLVNKPLQTDDWHVVDYVQQLERYISPGRINVVLYNNEPISPKLLKRYAGECEYPVHTEVERFHEIATSAIGAPLVSAEISARQAGDTLRRTLIRHDSERVCAEIRKILASS